MNSSVCKAGKVVGCPNMAERMQDNGKSEAMTSVWRERKPDGSIAKGERPRNA